MADILAIGGGFSSTTVELRAQTPAGCNWLQKSWGGGFACIGMTVRKSHAEAMLTDAQAKGLQLAWE